MAYSRIDQFDTAPSFFIGVAADTKPVATVINGKIDSLFYERDTGNLYKWSGTDTAGNWIQVQAGGSSLVSDPQLDYAASRVLGHSAVNKFGQATDVDSGVATDVWDGADGSTSTDVWVAPTTARLHDLTSTSANDTDTAGTGARKVKVYGLNSTWALQSETVNLNGVANVATANTYVRIFRLVVTEVGSGGSNAGVITATAQTDATVTAAILVGNNQALMAIYTVPAGYAAYMTSYYAAFTGGTPSTTEGNVQLLIREDASVSTTPYQIKHIQGLRGGENLVHEFKPYFRIPEKSDIKMHMPDCDTNNSTLSAGFDMVLIDE